MVADLIYKLGRSNKLSKYRVGEWKTGSNNNNNQRYLIIDMNFVLYRSKKKYNCKKKVNLIPGSRVQYTRQM